MRRKLQDRAGGPAKTVGLAIGAATLATGRPDAAQTRPRTARLDREQAQQLEGEEVLTLADAAMAGEPTPSDFAVRWQNDFLKAQRGTFVPFTLTIDASTFTRPAALVYIRAARRSDTNRELNDKQPRREQEKEDDGPRANQEFAVDAIFPVEFRVERSGGARVSRGFSAPPGDYDVIVVVRERIDPEAPQAKVKAAVLTQALSVPDFWSGAFTTSTVIVADRLVSLSQPLSAEELLERPYVIGRNDIAPAEDRLFGKNEEIIVVLLVYSPTVANGKFDVRVEYHFFRRGGAAAHANTKTEEVAHPPALEGERYFNRTDPQRFNPELMGSQFDPAAGQPLMAGQGVPLAAFEPGDYRLAIVVTDRLSGRSITREVLFTVVS